jgi:hypothetical protein
MRSENDKRLAQFGVDLSILEYHDIDHHGSYEFGMAK